jgi:hypothetical protein
LEAEEMAGMAVELVLALAEVVLGVRVLMRVVVLVVMVELVLI